MEDVARSLAGVDVSEIKVIMTGVNRIVLASFQNDVIIPGTLDLAGNAALAKPSQKAYRRRAVICMRLVARCRNDYRWSIRRTMDVLPEALRYTLEGQDWDPGPKTAINGAGTTRICWSPEAVAKFTDPLGLLS